MIHNIQEAVMDKFRWAYIGSGNIAASTARSILKGNNEIAAVYGRNEKTATAFAEKVGAAAVKSAQEAINFNGVDGVYIATPHTSHKDYAISALKCKKPVLCEKPVAVTYDDALEMIECAKENNVYFAEAMWTWFSDIAITIKKLINSGKIGDVRSVDICYSFPGVMMSKSSRVLTPETAGGALLDIGIYPITYCYNLFGYPDDIKCTGTLKDGIDIKETVVLTYGNMKCTLKMSLTSLKESCVIKGDAGEIKIPMFHMARTASVKSKTGNETVTGKTDYLTEFTRAADEIRRGKTESDYIPFSATLNCLKIMDECRRQMKLIYPFER